MEIIIHCGLVHYVTFAEEVHDFGVLAIETVLQLVQLAHRLVVQVALAVTLDHGHPELVHRIIGTQLAPHGVTLQVIHQALGGKVGTLVEALHLVASHLQLHVTVHDGETRLLILAELAVFTHHRTEGGGFFLHPVAERFHIIHDREQLVLHFKHELRTKPLIGVAPVTLVFLLFLLELFQKLLPVLGGQAF